MRIIILLISLTISGISLSEIHKKAKLCPETEQLCFYWWPVLPEVEGWQQDIINSYHFNANTQAPIGSNFGQAETVIYAKAIYTGRRPETKNLDQFIENDHTRFKQGEPTLKIKLVNPLKTKTGAVLKSYTFIPIANGNWERVAYGEDTDIDGNKYYLTFVISSRTSEGLNKTMNVYEKFVTNYK